MPVAISEYATRALHSGGVGEHMAPPVQKRRSTGAAPVAGMRHLAPEP
jgi:hypothetical protein